MARSLRAQQSNTIGLVVSDIRNPFFPSISMAVEDVAYEQGFSVFLCHTDEHPEKEAISLNLLRDENVAGVIFSPTRQTLANFTAAYLNFPLVVIDRSIPISDVDVVMLDHVDSAYRLTTHLIEHGYQRIAALCGEMSTTGPERRAGYEKALWAHGLAPLAEQVKYVQPKMEAGDAATMKLLASAEPPDALFTTNSLLGAEALLAIRERDLTILDDRALVTCDETTWASLVQPPLTLIVQPPLTLIAQPTDEIGKTATELLLQHVADPDRPTRQVILKGPLLVRGSSTPRR